MGLGLDRLKKSCELVADHLFKIGGLMVGWKKVKDTELARFMYPEYKEKEDGYILVPESIKQRTNLICQLRLKYTIKGILSQVFL